MKSSLLSPRSLKNLLELNYIHNMSIPITGIHITTMVKTITYSYVHTYIRTTSRYIHIVITFTHTYVQYIHAYTIMYVQGRRKMIKGRGATIISES